MASWKKIVTSGSNAELNHITSSGNFEITGNVSGSSTSTGSFGHIQTGTTGHAKLGYALVGDWPNTSTNAFFGNKDLDQSAVGNYALQQSTNGTTYLNTATSRDIHFRINNTTKMKLDSSGNLGVGHNISPTEKLDVAGNIKASGNISGSATSTGSFGRVEATTFVGDGSGLTGLTSAAIETYNTSGDNRILTSVNSSTVQGEAGLTFDGSELRVQGDIVAENFIVSSSVTHMTQSFSSGSTIFGDTEDDTHEFIGHVMMQSASFGMANHADRTNSNAANSYLFISQSVASKNGYVWQKAGNPGTNTFPFLLIDGANNQKASIRQDGRFSTPIVYLSNDNSGKLGEIDGDAGDSSAMYINANSRALQLSSEGKKTFKINTDGTTEIGGSGAYGVTNFGDLTVGGNLNLTSSAATLEVAGNISGSVTSTGSFGRVENASGKFRVLDTTSEISSPGLTQLHVFQDGLGLNTAAPSLRISNNGQGNGYDVTLSVGSATLNINKHVYLASHQFWGTGFNSVNSRGTAGTAVFHASGNGGDGGGMYFGGAGAYDVRFSTTEKERLRIDTEGNGGGIQTSGSVNIGGIGNTTAGLTVGGNAIIGGNLTVQGDTIQQQVANLNVEDRFILLNSGSASGDGGIVVQTESTNTGVAFAYDDSESRWAFQQGTKLSGDATTVAPDAYASAVVTSDDANYQKNGNIRVEGGEIYIYVE